MPTKKLSKEQQLKNRIADLEMTLAAEYKLTTTLREASRLYQQASVNRLSDNQALQTKLDNAYRLINAVQLSLEQFKATYRATPNA